MNVQVRQLIDNGKTEDFQTVSEVLESQINTNEKFVYFVFNLVEKLIELGLVSVDDVFIDCANIMSKFEKVQN